MKKTLLILVIALVFSLTSCVAPGVVNINEDISYTNIVTYDDDIYFRVFRLYVPNNESMQDYTYGYQVKTNKDVSIVFMAPDDEVIFSDEVRVFLYKDLTQSISSNTFVGKCIDNDTITVEITFSDNTIHTFSFEYFASRPTYYEQESFPTISIPQFDIWIIVTTISILITLFLVSIYTYRFFYQRRINHSLTDELTSKNPLMDLNLFIKISLFITIVFMIAFPILEKVIYNHTVIQDISYEELSMGVLEMDLTDVTMTNIQYERIVVSINLDVVSRSVFERDLDLTYTNIEDNILNILNNYNHQVVDYDKNYTMIGSYPWTTETHYIVELETADQSTIIIRFILLSEDEYSVVVTYLPAHADFPEEDGITIISGSPKYSFTVPNTDSNVVALFGLLDNATRITP